MQSAEHAARSAKEFGGKMEDYLDIHVFLDSSKATINDARHRALTHNSWFIREVIPRVFGQTRRNSARKTYSTVDVAERHVLEDFNMLFVPTPQDFLAAIPLQDWMDNARNNDVPPSREALKEVAKYKVTPFSRDSVLEIPELTRPKRRCAGRGVID